MELNDYCGLLKSSLTIWKAKIYYLMREANRISPADKKKVEASIEELNDIVGGIDKEIKQLEQECPVEWEAEMEAMQAKFEELEKKSMGTWRDLSPDDY